MSTVFEHAKQPVHMCHPNSDGVALCGFYAGTRASSTDRLHEVTCAECRLAEPGGCQCGVCLDQAAKRKTAEMQEKNPMSTKDTIHLDEKPPDFHLYTDCNDSGVNVCIEYVDPETCRSVSVRIPASIWRRMTAPAIKERVDDRLLHLSTPGAL